MPLDISVELARLTLEIEQAKKETEQEVNRGRMLEARAKGVRGASLTPSALAKAMNQIKVDFWFAPKNNIKFNKVTKQGEDQKSWTYSQGKATQSTFYTQDNTDCDAKKQVLPEDPVQKAWLPSFDNVIIKAKENNVFWVDSHARHWLGRPDEERNNKRAPDGVACATVVQGNSDPDPAKVIGFFDCKCHREGKFTDDDKGKLFQYCILILEFYQPMRTFIGASLFDGKYAQCFQVFHEGIEFHVKASRVLDLSDMSDARLYAGFYTSPEAMGWNLSGILPETVGNKLGWGATSVVFADSEHDDRVYKVFIDTALHTSEERNVLSLFQCDHIVQLHEADSCDNGYLTLTPKFDRLSVRFPFNATILCTLIESKDSPLRVIHDGGYVFCDLRPDNIMVADDDKLALVDLGAVRHKDDASPYTHGTLSFASDRVLDAYQNQDSIKVTPADDLVSLVRCFIVFDQLPDSFKARIDELGRNVDNIKTFWQHAQQCKLWIDHLLAAARSVNYHLLIKLMKQRELAGIPEGGSSFSSGL
jgi:hypothetical protein